MPGKLGEGNFAKLSSFPGYSKWQDRNLIFRITGANILHALREWPEAEWIGGAEDVRKTHEDFALQATLAIEQKRTGQAAGSDSAHTYARPPMEHQRQALLLSWDRPAFGLFMEQGTGKTKVIIDNAVHLYQAGKIDMLIIVAWPNGVHRNWIEYELPVDMGIPYAAEFWSSNHASLAKRKALRKVTLMNDRLRVFSFNVEAFRSAHAEEFMLELLAGWRCMLVIDQSASIKNPQAQCTKFLIDKCSELAPYRRILDGSPVA